MESGRELEGEIIADRYLLAEYLASGNFGWVYRGEQQLLGQYVRTVAIKITKMTDITEATARTVFQEPIILARIVEEVEDPEITRRLVHVHDLGLLPEHDGRGFIVMGFVDGGTLADILRDTQMSQWDALEYAVDICAGMAGVHSLDPPIVHRDLKPDNLLLTRRRQLRIADFGLAARVLAAVGYAPGVAGTTLWMAPETMRPRQAHSSTRSDVYSIGLILYRMLTGKQPYEHLVTPRGLSLEEEADWLHTQRMTLVVPPPSRTNATVTAEMDEIVMRALSPQEHSRFTDAGDMLRALKGMGHRKRDPRTEALRQAEEAWDRRDIEAAVEAYACCRDEAPDAEDVTAFEATRGLARCHAAGQHWSEAGTLYREAERINERCVALKTKAARRDFFGEIADCFREAGSNFMALSYDRKAGRSQS